MNKNQRNATGLSADQRWLLLHMGGWQIVAALCTPDGVRGLMNCRWGSTGGRQVASSAPQWLKGCGWDTEASTITPRWIEGKPVGAPTFTIKAAAITRFANQLPDGIKAELVECHNASTANAVLRGRFCHCGSKKCGYGYLKDRICPPTSEQEQAASDEYWRIREWENHILFRALAPHAEEHDNSGQLELFEAVNA